MQKKHVSHHKAFVFQRVSVFCIHKTKECCIIIFFCCICSPFPTSLRFLIQQHLELMHTLQERVLKCQWQGIVGDVFMRLTSKEVPTLTDDQ